MTVTGPFSDFQNEIYLKGLFGELPALPFDWREIRDAALAVMTDQAIGYVEGAAGAEDTAAANRAAFGRWKLVPRMLRGIPAARSHATSVLGTAMPAPVMLAPVGVLSIVHPDAEPAVARAAARLGVPFVVSTASSTPMEEVAAAADGPEVVPALLAGRTRPGRVVRLPRRSGPATRRSSSRWTPGSSAGARVT